MFVCHEPGCEAPAEMGEWISMQGVSHKGNIWVWFAKFTCSNGHRYQLEVAEE